jgi:restriction endonuclease S subunit
MKYSIVSRANIINSIYGDRIDAEFFLPIYLNVEQTLNHNKYKLLGKVTSKIDVGHVGPMVNEYNEDGVWLIQTQNVREFFLNNLNKTYINEKFHRFLIKSQVHDGDILIARSGSFGVASIYLGNETVNSADIIIIRSKDNEIDPLYLLTFLNCKYGSNQLLRFASGGVQGHVNLTILESLMVADLGQDIQKLIAKTIYASYFNKISSEKSIKSAEAIILSELGLEHWQPKHVLSFVKNYSDTINAERVDAEYYQPKYDEIEEAIKKYKGGWARLDECFKLNISKFKAVDRKKYNYLEIGGVNIVSGEIEPITLEFKELPANAKIRLKSGDLVISKVRTYRGAVALIDRDDLVGSGAFTVLQENGGLSKEVLFILLKSLPYCQYSMKFNTGCSYPTLIDEDILHYPIPIYDDKIQKQITCKVVESICLLQKAKSLIETAKKAVEIAIENDKKSAEEFIKSEVKKMGVNL